MKKLSLLTKLYFLAIVIFAVSSCETDEDPFIPSDNPPIISLVSEAGFLSEDATLSAGETINVKVSASQGTNPMNALTIYEDGVKVATSRLTVNGGTVGDAAVLLIGDDKTSLTWEIAITGADTDGTRNYEFEVTDEGQLTSSAFISITTMTGTLGISITESSPICVNPDQLFALNITATRGGAPLASLYVLENDMAVDAASRLRYDDASLTPFTSNPESLSVDDENGFTKKIFVRANASGGTSTYKVGVTDTNGDSEEVTFDVITTDLTVLTGVLLNRSQTAAGTGGLNLLDGQSTGTVTADSTNAHIRDMGNDANGDWRLQIRGMDGTTLKTPDYTTLPETFSYSSTNKSSVLQGAYDTGITVGVSEKLEDGDVFLLEKNGNYFIIQVIQTQDAAGVIDDFVEFNIKYF